MEKNYGMIWNMIRDRLAETIVMVLLFLSGIILIYAGKNWAWGCFIISALDLIVVIILFISISKDMFNDNVERITRETVERIIQEKSQPHSLR